MVLLMSQLRRIFCLEISSDKTVILKMSHIFQQKQFNDLQKTVIEVALQISLLCWIFGAQTYLLMLAYM